MSQDADLLTAQLDETLGDVGDRNRGLATRILLRSQMSDFVNMSSGRPSAWKVASVMPNSR